MKRAIFIPILLLAVNLVFSQPVSDSFIFPVQGDNVTTIYQNTLDPRSGGLQTASTAYAGPGGWYDFGNPFGASCPTCLPPPEHIYHPGADYNRYDNREGNSNIAAFEPVYSIGDGTVIRVSRTAYGWAVVIRYDLPGIVNLSNYTYPGTVPTQVVKNATGIVFMYQHLVSNILVEMGSKEDYRPEPIKQTVHVIKGQVVGYIDKNAGHLHGDMRAYNNSVAYLDASGTAYKNNDGHTPDPSGYYITLQKMTDYHHIDPNKFLNEFMVGRLPNVSTLEAFRNSFVSAYDASGGFSSVGSVWDRTSTKASDDFALVHYWPDLNGNPQLPGSNDALRVQDFLKIRRDEHNTTNNPSDDTFSYLWIQFVENPRTKQVIPVQDKILEFWHNNNGYSLLGAPEKNQIIFDGKWRQYFEKGYLTYDGSTPKVTLDELVIAGIGTHQVTIQSTPSGAETPVGSIVLRLNQPFLPPHQSYLFNSLL